MTVGCHWRGQKGGLEKWHFGVWAWEHEEEGGEGVRAEQEAAWRHTAVLT